MKIPAISQLMKVLRPLPVLDKAARAMAAHPSRANRQFGELVTFINNTAHDRGVGFIGRDALDAGARLQQAVTENGVRDDGNAPSRQQFARQLQYLGPLKQNFAGQKGWGGVNPERDEVIDRLIHSIERLQNFRGA